jgi:hypothetical protein
LNCGKATYKLFCVKRRQNRASKAENLTGPPCVHQCVLPFFYNLSYTIQKETLLVFDFFSLKIKQLQLNKKIPLDGRKKKGIVYIGQTV